MDKLTKELHAFLVTMGLNPSAVDSQVEHYIEHLLHLLLPEDEEAMTHYYGLFGEAQLGLGEIAQRLHLDQETAMERIDQCVRKLAVTPEWQMIKELLKKK